MLMHVSFKFSSGLSIKLAEHESLTGISRHNGDMCGCSSALPIGTLDRYTPTSEVNAKAKKEYSWRKPLPPIRGDSACAFRIATLNAQCNAIGIFVYGNKKSDGFSRSDAPFSGFWIIVSWNRETVFLVKIERRWKNGRFVCWGGQTPRRRSLNNGNGCFCAHA